MQDSFKWINRYVNFSYKDPANEVKIVNFYILNKTTSPIHNDIKHPNKILNGKLEPINNNLTEKYVELLEIQAVVDSAISVGLVMIPTKLLKLIPRPCKIFNPNFFLKLHKILNKSLNHLNMKCVQISWLMDSVAEELANFPINLPLWTIFNCLNSATNKMLLKSITLSSPFKNTKMTFFLKII